MLDGQAAEGEALIGAENGRDRASIRRLYSVDMQFIGQTHLLRVAARRTARSTARPLRTRFEEVYSAASGSSWPEIRRQRGQCQHARSSARAPALDLSTLIDPAGRARDAGRGARPAPRPVCFDGGWHETPVYWRDHLPEGFALTGPAIVEQMDTTVADRARRPGRKATPTAISSSRWGRGA